MLETHEQGPHRMRLIDSHRSVGIIQARMVLNHINNGVVDLLTVFMDLPDSRPEHISHQHVIPKHLIYTNLKDRFEVRIDRFVQYTCDTELIDVQTRCVTVIEDLWMTQSMNGRTVFCVCGYQSTPNHCEYSPTMNDNQHNK